MTPAEEQRLRRLGGDANSIAALTRMLSAALAADPDTATESTALDGITLLAARLSGDLLDLAGEA